jgi:transposase-like protein
VGTIELAIPKVRTGSYFPFWTAFLRGLVKRGLRGVKLGRSRRCRDRRSYWLR